MSLSRPLSAVTVTEANVDLHGAERIEKVRRQFRRSGQTSELLADATQLSEGLTGGQLAEDKSGQALFCQLATCQA